MGNAPITAVAGAVCASAVIEAEADGAFSYADRARAAKGGEVAVLALGWFWGPQAEFEQVKGVLRTVVGYTGGPWGRPSYRTVCGGDGHTEAILVEFDPSVISYARILDHFFGMHSPYSSRSKVQYRSAIWPQSPEQLEAALAAKAAKSKGGRKVQTAIEPPKPWHDAEGYHQHYLRKNDSAFCMR